MTRTKPNTKGETMATATTDARTITGKAAMIREIRKPGKVYVYATLGEEFPIEKQAAMEHVQANSDDIMLLVWPDGYKRLERND